LQLLVHAYDEVPDHLVDHAHPAIELFHQLTGAADRLDDVGALAVMGDLVGQLLAAPVLGLVERAAEALDDLLDLRVQICDLLLGGLGRHDVDELVLSCCAHDSPYGHLQSGLGPEPRPEPRAVCARAG
jgi:hypothetical protein